MVRLLSLCLAFGWLQAVLGDGSITQFLKGASDISEGLNSGKFSGWNCSGKLHYGCAHHTSGSTFSRIPVNYGVYTNLPSPDLSLGGIYYASETAQTPFSSLWSNPLPPGSSHSALPAPSIVSSPSPSTFPAPQNPGSTSSNSQLSQNPGSPTSAEPGSSPLLPLQSAAAPICSGDCWGPIVAAVIGAVASATGAVLAIKKRKQTLSATNTTASSGQQISV